jgi:hypothetical protein
MPRRFVTLVLLACAATGANAQALKLVEVPVALKPAAEESLAVMVAAKGVQIYECRSAANGRAEWAFVAPEADLFDADGAPIGTHYAGPQWEWYDASRIAGTVKARADAPRPDAIPWLLLSAKSLGAAGTLAGVTSIQRVNTVGGIAPRDGCSPGTVGAVKRVGYTADYYFFTAR